MIVPSPKKTIPPQCPPEKLHFCISSIHFQVIRSHVFDVLEGLSPRNGMKLQLIWPNAQARLLLHHISASVPELHPSRPLKVRGVPIPSACDKTWVPAPMLKDIQTWLTGKSRGKKSFEGTKMEKGPISTLIPPMRHRKDCAHLIKSSGSSCVKTNAVIGERSILHCCSSVTLLRVLTLVSASFTCKLCVTCYPKSQGPMQMANVGLSQVSSLPLCALDRPFLPVPWSRLHISNMFAATLTLLRV